MNWVRICCLAVASAFAMEPECGFAESLDQLTDLTGRVQPIVTLKGRDNFASEYRYDVSVRNLSPDAIIGDSLIIVLDKITNLAGEDREGLTGESFLDDPRAGPRSPTDDGKPYFRVPAGTAPDLAPQTDSLPAVVRIRNRDYVVVFTPSFKVFGQKRPPPGIEACGVFDLSHISGCWIVNSCKSQCGRQADSIADQERPLD